MDYLFDKTVTKIPETYSISCYYIVDSHLRYVSLYKNTYFYLHYVDSYVVGEKIMESKNEKDFDSYAFNQNKPIISMYSNIENIDSEYKRVVHIRTIHNNPLSKKSKKPQDSNIMLRYRDSNKKKLF